MAVQESLIFTRIWGIPKLLDLRKCVLNSAIA
jgi:hypothetical protein